MKLKKIIDFIKNNRLLTAICVIVVFICLALIFNIPFGSSTKPLDQNISYYSTKDFTVTNENGKITVESRNPGMTNPTIIKNTLGIPADQDITVVVPGASLGKTINSQPLPGTVVPTVED